MKSDKNKRILRQAGRRDKKALYALWQDCFGDTKAFSDYYFKTYFSENKVLMLEDDGSLKAMLHQNPYRISFNHHMFEGCYIVGVATDKDYRHQGAMTQLLKRTFSECYEDGLPFVYLMPADAAIYEPFAFSYIYDQWVEGMEGFAQRGQNQEPTPTEIDYRRARWQGDYEYLADLANDVLEKSYAVYTRRDAHYFRRLQQENQVDGGDLLMLYADGACIGYVSYAFEEKFYGREIYCLPKWQDKVVKWLFTYLNESDFELLPLMQGRFFNESYGAWRIKKPIIMGRIVNLKNWLSMLPTSPHRFVLYIEVMDAWMKENQGIWVLACDGKTYQVAKTERAAWDGDGQSLQVPMGKQDTSEKENSRVDVRIGIDSLMQWLTGYKSLDTLIQDEKLELFTDCKNVLKEMPVLHGIFINEVV